MKRKIKSNSGFTLIELIIAMAILAFLMTAVSSFMGSSVLSFRKTNSDLRVNYSATELYTQLSDTIMQANEIVIVGYTSSSNLDFTPGYEVNQTTISTALTPVVCVKDEEMKQKVILNPARYGITGSIGSYDFKLFSELKDPSTKMPFEVYVSAIIVDTAVPLDLSYAPSANPNGTSWNVTDSFSGSVVTVSATGTVYDTNDTAVNTFIFDEKQVYYGIEYGFMTDLNDKIDLSSSATMENNLYCKSLNYVMCGTGTVGQPVTGCIVKVDAGNGAIDLELSFYDNNSTFTSNGRINTRNSYVLVPKK